MIVGKFMELGDSGHVSLPEGTRKPTILNTTAGCSSPHIHLGPSSTHGVKVMCPKSRYLKNISKSKLRVDCKPLNHETNMNIQVDGNSDPTDSFPMGKPMEKPMGKPMRFSRLRLRPGPHPKVAPGLWHPPSAR